MRLDTSQALSGQTITFRRQAIDVRADLRPRWMVSAVVLILAICGRTGRASRQKVHALAWSLLSERTRHDFTAVLDGSDSPDSLSVRFDPTVNRAIDLAIGLGLARKHEGDRIELTELGVALAASLRESRILVTEATFLGAARRRVSEANIENVLYWRGIE